MAKNELKELLKMFDDGNGFGNPDSRMNAELRLQVIIAQKQEKMASRLNWFTFFLVVATLLNAIVLAIQVWRK